MVEEGEGSTRVKHPGFLFKKVGVGWVSVGLGFLFVLDLRNWILRFIKGRFDL